MRIVRKGLARLAPERVRTAAALALAVAIAGCAEVTTPPASIAGAWSLSSANGAPPPVLLFEAGSDASHLISLTLTFDRNGSYTSTGIVSSCIGGVTTQASGNDRGVWTVSGDSLTLRSLGGGISSLEITPEKLLFFDSSTLMTMSFSRAR
jgi:hypothetical protein